LALVTDSRGAEMIRGTEREHQGFVHSALLYHSQREFLDSVVGFVDDGLSMDEAVLVAVPGENLALLRDSLGGAGGLPAGLQMADSADVARNPSRFLALEGSFAEEHPDQRVRIVSQVFWPGRTATEIPACLQHEALVNGAFASRQLTALCLYDA